MNTQASSMEADHHPCMDIKTYRRLAGRYSSVLERAKEYLRKRKSCTWQYFPLVSKRCEAGAECPMCGEAFREGSFNTEHIHSKCLGGLKSSDVVQPNRYVYPVQRRQELGDATHAPSSEEQVSTILLAHG